MAKHSQRKRGRRRSPPRDGDQLVADALAEAVEAGYLTIEFRGRLLSPDEIRARPFEPDYDPDEEFLVTPSV